MQTFVASKELEQIAEGLVETLFGDEKIEKIDVDKVADFLGITVIYETFAESDIDKIGFVSNGATPLAVWEHGEKVYKTFPKDTVVLERFLKTEAEEKRRRFTLAHEISHVLIERAAAPFSASHFSRLYDGEREYDIAELRRRLSVEECQANAMAASVLMPRRMLLKAVRRLFRKSRIAVYGDCVFLPKAKPLLNKLADELGVSYTALVIRLRKCGLLEQRDMAEYFEKTRPKRS